MSRQIFPWALLLAWWCTASGGEPAVRFQSATPATVLLELYTSEGCSSCPPAEKWLSRQVGSPQLWRDFVPVAFHVDYWDDLGWRDPWSKAEFSERQRQYGAKWRSKTIYTPEIVVDGKEWRGWQGRDIPRNTTPIGILSASSADTNLWSIRFNPTSSAPADFQAHAVWLIGNVTAAVQAGENEGRTLRHDFIAISLVTAPMHHLSDGWECKLNLKPPAGARSGREAVAVAFWVTKAGQLESLQATGGWLKRPQ
jgi:hypothetical protein